MVLAHRLAWEAARGPIPPGLTVDHLCRNRPCVNPAHLRLLTNLENARDNGMATRTHCPQHHPYDEANTYFTPIGHRRCRACGRARYHQTRGSHLMAPPSDLSTTDIEHRFAYRQPGETRAPIHAEVRAECERVAHHINALCPNGRELSLAITKLEEAAMWANAAIARGID